MRRCRFILIFVVSLVGCRGPAHDVAVNEPLPASRYIKRTNAELVVVFVPGLYGDAVSTWTNDKTHAYWPELISRDPAFKDSDVYAYAHSSPQKQTIDEMVENLSNRLTSDEVFQAHKRVVFICHSLGGVIVRAYLLRHRNQAAQVPLLFLLSVPSTGAEVNRLVTALGDNGTKENLSYLNSSLMNIDQEWRAANLPVTTHCAYELLPVFGVLVVSADNLRNICDGVLDPVNRDHVQIAKPADRTDISYISFRIAFEKEAFQPVPPAQQFVTETVASEPQYFELGCGESKTFQYKVAPGKPLRANQQIVSVTAVLQDAANLKDFRILAVSNTATDATVTIGASGLDRDWTTNCRGGGHGRVVATFVFIGPAGER
jgi:predicted alpha/beta hydrolase family esterase